MILLTAAILAPEKPLILAHYMPWYAAKPVSKEWGWHWTMGKLNPDKGERASHYRPLMGLYDSGDPDAVECHVLLMKFAGIDGVIVDWYGNLDHYDYLANHRNTQLMFRTAQRAGLKYCVVYEDQTVPRLVEGGKFGKDDAVAQGKKLMEWVDRNWFRSPSYLKIGGRPVFLVFGPQYYKSPDWEQMFAGLSPKPAFFTLHHRREPALGAYDWPLPRGGDEGNAKERAGFFERAKSWPAFIPVAYPRFHDYYKEAGVHDSWGRLEDRGGRTFEWTLKEALESKAAVVQLATWNDWGEGTMIEPSVEFGYRDLETIQRLRRRYRAKAVPYTTSDLRLPMRLYKLRKAYARNRALQSQLRKVSNALFAGKLEDAARSLATAERRLESSNTP